MVGALKLTPQERAKDRRLRRIYGITWLEYCALLRAQKGGCAICGRKPTRNLLSVDHHHVLADKKHRGVECRDRVRGLLDFQCNRALGKFRDNPEILRRAADYLENPPAVAVLKRRKKP